MSNKFKAAKKDGDTLLVEKKDDKNLNSLGIVANPILEKKENWCQPLCHSSPIAGKCYLRSRTSSATQASNPLRGQGMSQAHIFGLAGKHNSHNMHQQMLQLFQAIGEQQ